MSLITTTIDTPIGPMTAAADDRGLRLLEHPVGGRVEAQAARLERALGATIRPGDHGLIDQIAGELSEYFAGERTRFETPLAPAGTPFQRRVWDALLEIPIGETRSYAALARAIGQPRAVRAVGRANGANPLSIVVPCHRVIQSGGALGGYGGGLDRKQQLLEHERRVSGAALFV